MTHPFKLFSQIPSHFSMHDLCSTVPKDNHFSTLLPFCTPRHHNHLQITKRPEAGVKKLDSHPLLPFCQSFHPASCSITSTFTTLMHFSPCIIYHAPFIMHHASFTMHHALFTMQMCQAQWTGVCVCGSGDSRRR